MSSVCFKVRVTYADLARLMNVLAALLESTRSSVGNTV